MPENNGAQQSPRRPDQCPTGQANRTTSPTAAHRAHANAPHQPPRSSTPSRSVLADEQDIEHADNPAIDEIHQQPKPLTGHMPLGPLDRQIINQTPEPYLPNSHSLSCRNRAGSGAREDYSGASRSPKPLDGQTVQSIRVSMARNPLAPGALLVGNPLAHLLSAHAGRGRCSPG